MILFAGLGVVALYLILVGAVLPPRAAVYMTVAAWLLLPAGGASVINIRGMPLHDYASIVMGVGLALALLRVGSLIPPRGPIRTFILLLVAGSIAHVAALALAYVFQIGYWVPLGESIEVSSVARATTSDILAMRAALSAVRVLFFVAVAKLIRSEDHFLVLFRIILLVAIGSGLEFVLASTVLAGSPVTRFSFNPSGAFNSTILNDYGAVGMLGGSGIAIAILFYALERRPIYLALIPLLGLQVLYSYQRTPVVASIIGISVLGWAIAPTARWPRRLGIVSAAAGLVFLAWAYNLDYRAAVQSFYSGTFRETQAITLESMFTRFGLQLRVVEVIIARAPVGVGSGMVSQYMISESAPSFFSGRRFVDSVVESEYHRALTGEKATGAHNAYLNTVAEHGIWIIPAMLTMLRILALRFAGFRRWRRSLMSRTPTTEESVRFSLTAASWGGLAVMAVAYMTQVEPNMFIIYGVFVVAIIELTPRRPYETPSTVGQLHQ